MPDATVTPIRPPMPDEPDFQVEHVDPTKLLIDDQVRGDANPDEQLVDSIREHGILQPPTVAYDPARGGLVIITGHRRVGAAITAGLTLIPVLRRPLAVARDAARLEQQIVENERRKQLTSGDLARGYQRLELFGLTPEDIARHLGEKQTRVAAGITARRSTAAAAALDTHPDIDLEQAAIIAEFDDTPDTQAELTTIAARRPAEFAREVAWRRSQRDLDARVVELTAEAADHHAEIVGQYVWDNRFWDGGTSANSWNRDGARLDALADLTPAAHETCPGHAAIINNARTAGEAELQYVCTDWKTNGHTRPVIDLGGQATTDPEEAERRREWEEQQAATAKQRALIAANTTARRDWIRDHMNERSRRPDALLYAALADAAFAVEDINPYEFSTTVYLLTGDELGYAGAEDRLRELLAGPVTPLRALAAWALAVADEAPYAPIYARHLDRLQAWGYQLTDIDREQLTALADADDETTAEED